MRGVTIRSFFSSGVEPSLRMPSRASGCRLLESAARLAMGCLLWFGGSLLAAGSTWAQTAAGPEPPTHEQMSAALIPIVQGLKSGGTCSQQDADLLARSPFVEGKAILATCYEQQGKLLSSREALRRAIAPEQHGLKHRLPGNEVAFIAEVSARLKALEERIPTLIVDGSLPEGAVLVVCAADSSLPCPGAGSLTLDSSGVPLEIDPGEYRILLARVGPDGVPHERATALRASGANSGDVWRVSPGDRIALAGASRSVLEAYLALQWCEALAERAPADAFDLAAYCRAREGNYSAAAGYWYRFIEAIDGSLRSGDADPALHSKRQRAQQTVASYPWVLVQGESPPGASLLIRGLPLPTGAPGSSSQPSCTPRPCRPTRGARTVLNHGRYELVVISSADRTIDRQAFSISEEQPFQRLAVRERERRAAPTADSIDYRWWTGGGALVMAAAAARLGWRSLKIHAAPIISKETVTTDLLWLGSAGLLYWTWNDTFAAGKDEPPTRVGLHCTPAGCMVGAMGRF